MFTDLVAIMLFASAVFICCALSNKLSSKFGFPALLIFMVLGMLFGTDGILKIDFNDFHISNDMCTIALLFIIFYGGFGTNWRAAKEKAPQSIILSTLGVLLTAGITGIFCFTVLKMNILDSLLTGAVIGSTDAASVFYILRSRNLNLKNGLASVLEVESGSNDPMAYTLTIIILTFMEASKTVTVGNITFLVILQFLAGIFFGVLIGIIASWFMRKVLFEGSGIQIIFVVAIALASYGLSAKCGGNGFLSVYITGIILGNTKFPFKTGLVHFFDGVTWMMQILLFFLLGLLAKPSNIPSILGTAILIVVFLTFVARPIAVAILLAPFKTPFRDTLLVSWAGLRGGASIAFAIMAVVTSPQTNFDLFHIVFCVSLFSVAFQGSLLPFVARKLSLVDSTADVHKTFSDYQDPSAMQLIDISITENHPWANKFLMDIKLQDVTYQQHSLAVLIKRQTEYIRPRGNSLILPGDIIVTNTIGVRSSTELHLDEERISLRHKWNNKKICEITLPNDEIVVLVQRGDEPIIPNGNTLLTYGDVVVIGHMPKQK